MRDLTKREEYQLQLGRCPACGCGLFQPGPRGGLSQNFECTDCGRRFNLAIAAGILLVGQFIGDADTGTDWTRFYAAHRPHMLREILQEMADDSQTHQ